MQNTKTLKWERAERSSLSLNRTGYSAVAHEIIKEFLNRIMDEIRPTVECSGWL
jgi:hypothetical protein